MILQTQSDTVLLGLLQTFLEAVDDLLERLFIRVSLQPWLDTPILHQLVEVQVASRLTRDGSRRSRTIPVALDIASKKGQTMGWEYQTLQFDFDSEAFISQGGLFNSQKFNHELNRLGWDGWELVSIFDTNQIKGGTRYVVAVLKRPLTAERRAALQT